MELTTEQIHERTLQLLREAMGADPAAMYALMCARTPVNQALADHPTIVVEVASPVSNCYTLGVLGLINGLLERLGAQKVAVMWADNELGTRMLMGFVPCVPQQENDVPIT